MLLNWSTLLRRTEIFSCISTLHTPSCRWDWDGGFGQRKKSKNLYELFMFYPRKILKILEQSPFNHCKFISFQLLDHNVFFIQTHERSRNCLWNLFARLRGNQEFVAEWVRTGLRVQVQILNRWMQHSKPGVRPVLISQICPDFEAPNMMKSDFSPSDLIFQR